jgi:hypothetical protein
VNNEQFLASLSFEFLGPEAPRGDGHRFAIAREGRPPARLLELPNSPVDAFNTRLPVEDERTRRTLLELCEIPRMSTFAIAAIIDHAVRGMPDGHAFLNVGVWAGFTFLSGVARNPGRRCIGVDDFSGFGGPRETFTTRFEKLASSEHSFFEMDYQRYFAEVHSEPLGVYMYDGDHAYDHQLQGLKVAEPFFGPGCLVLVDDTNRDEPRQGTHDFIEKSDREYRMLLDCRTADSAHPTFWDGLMVLEATGAARTGPVDTSEAASRGSPAASAGPSPEAGSLVSIVIVDEGTDRAQLDVALGAASAQTWPDCEAVVTDRAGIRDAIATTDGDYIAFTGASTPLPNTAVHMGLAFPNESQFFRRLGGPRYREQEAALPSLERR